MTLNVFKFSIFIKNKKNSSDIKQSIINSYSEKSKHNGTYMEFVKKKWIEIEKEQIKTIYSEKAIVTYNKISNTRYFLVELDEHDSIDQVTYEVIVISYLDDVSQALNYAFDDIKTKLKSFKLTLIDNKALLFIYDGNDIISNRIMIKSNIFSYSGFKIKEIVRMIIILLLAIIALIVSISSTDNTTDNVCYSVIASCIFFLITEGLLKISFKKTIEIKDLTNWVEKRDDLSHAPDELSNGYKDLKNPAV